MSVRQMTLVVAGWGLATAAALLIGLDTVGGLLALVHLGAVVGAPLALLLARQVRSVPVAVVLSIALSLALSALASQMLIWFGVASRELLVLTATAYSGVLASLLPPPGDEWVQSR
jgi:hypothetical protein